MIYKLHVTPEELTIIDAAMDDYILLRDEQEAAVSAAHKIALLKEYIDANTKAFSAGQVMEKAKQAYNACVRKSALPTKTNAS